MLSEKQSNKDFTSDIDYHLSEIKTDLNKAKFDNNRNFNLVRLIGNLLDRVKLLKELIVREPKSYFNTIYAEMKRLYKEAFGELDGVHITIPFKENPDPSRMGSIKMSMPKNILEDEE